MMVAILAVKLAGADAGWARAVLTERVSSPTYKDGSRRRSPGISSKNKRFETRQSDYASAARRSAKKCRTALEQELEPQLHGSGAMSVNGMEKSAGAEATWIPSATICVAIAVDYVVAGITGMGWIVDAKLGVVEQIKSLDAELQRAAFG
jgi:hypothetical protein